MLVASGSVEISKVREQDGVLVATLSSNNRLSARRQSDQHAKKGMGVEGLFSAALTNIIFSGAENNRRANLLAAV